ncbi:MAG: hypothetical protein RQ982_03120 [Gammaproteobacteria bacterium]|nr:hypothetical protein [Gammaproteobacteria bacterium]
MNKRNLLYICFLFFSATAYGYAGEVEIISADFQRTGKTTWSIDVTLRHDDTGWDHYADSWRVLDAEGSVLAERILLHPHINEQPFTRSLSGVKIPETTRAVYVEAHDRLHGWSTDRLAFSLDKTDRD